VSFQIGKVTFKHTILASRLPTMAAGNLGVNFLTPRRAVLDLGGSTMTLCQRVDYVSVQTLQVSSKEADCGTEGKQGLIPHVIVSTTFTQSRSEESRNVSQVRSDTPHGRSEIPKQLVESDAWSVTCKHTVELKPRAKHIACGQVVGENLRSSPTLVCVEPALTPIQGICVAQVLTYMSVAGSKTQKKEASASVKSTGFETHSSCSVLRVRV
jgi:hypothetical protein